MSDFLISNQFGDYKNPSLSPGKINISNGTEIGQRVKLAELMEHISGVEIEVVHDKTVFGLKAGAMNGLFLTAEKLTEMHWFGVEDRQVHHAGSESAPSGYQKDDDKFQSGHHCGVPEHHLYSGPGGQRRLCRGGRAWGSMESLNDHIGTGWASKQKTLFHQVMLELSDPKSRFRHFTGNDDPEGDLLGIIPFAPNSFHPSEDHASQLEQGHLANTLGYDPEYALSWAIAHKMREALYGAWSAASLVVQRSHQRHERYFAAADQ